ncbi:MAG: hypothetical protein H7840_09370 [Alphaproteobacteria bacterium]
MSDDDLLLCGWRVRSGLPLPDLLPWTGDDRPPDIWVRVGTPPERLDDLVERTPFAQIDASGRVLLTLPVVARYLITGGREVVVEPAPEAEAPEIQGFLLGTVFGYLVHQRGLLPLHAACLSIGGMTLALMGVSGAGKSSLAAQLVKRGHRLVSDDVCVLDTTRPDGPWVRPTFPRLKLWRDTLDALGIAANGLERNRQGREKYLCRTIAARAFSPEPARLGGLVLLAEGIPGRPPRLERLRGFTAQSTVAEHIYRRRQALALGRDSALFTAAAMVAAKVPVWALEPPRDLNALDALAEVVEELARR